ncbi:MAG TPA: winged helix-turn-helix domain-containing protein [Actinomycetota bacterium]|jgi:DNA-binding response OmpR family regulator|nr:winged helix-turn-helix domain-containing protein [Actinomycetota bacterium]
MQVRVGAGDSLAVGRLTIELDAYRAHLADRALVLTPAQFDLLAYLVRNRDRVVTRDELAVAGRLEHMHSVDVTLSSLRRVLGAGFIRNVRNRGWIIEPDAVSS